MVYLNVATECIQDSIKKGRIFNILELWWSIESFISCVILNVKKQTHTKLYGFFLTNGFSDECKRQSTYNGEWCPSLLVINIFFLFLQCKHSFLLSFAYGARGPMYWWKSVGDYVQVQRDFRYKEKTLKCIHYSEETDF